MMKTHELLELAALDALGLLDEGERESFDRAFRAAPPALQAQIRREQTRIAGDDSFLPRVEVPLGLKARVVAAWREAVDAMAGSATRTSSGRRIGGLTLLPSRGVSSLWRAGAIGCAAASVVLAVTMLNVRDEFDKYADVSNQNSQDEFWANEFGARWVRAITSPTTKVVQFDPSSAAVKTGAVLLIDAETNTGHLYVRQLPQAAAGYALVALDADGHPMLDEEGNLKKLCVIKSTGSDAGSAFQDRIKIAPGQSVGLVAADVEPGEATLLLRGRNL
jgi:hypothetical protein